MERGRLDLTAFGSFSDYEDGTLDMALLTVAARDSPLLRTLDRLWQCLAPLGRWRISRSCCLRQVKPLSSFRGDAESTLARRPATSVFNHTLDAWNASGLCQCTHDPRLSIQDEANGGLTTLGAGVLMVHKLILCALVTCARPPLTRSSCHGAATYSLEPDEVARSVQGQDCSLEY